MAQLIVRKNPLNSSNEYIDIKPNQYLVDELNRLYPNGFPNGVTPKVYKDAPLDSNEFELTEEVIINESDIIWLVFYPQGVDPVTLFIIFAVSFVIGKVVANLIENAFDDMFEDLESGPTGTAGVASSANNQLRGQRNRIRLGEKISQVYGELRVWPDMLSDELDLYPLSEPELDGNPQGAQILTQTFLISEGAADQFAPRLGNDPLDADASTAGTVTLFSISSLTNGRRELIPQFGAGDAISIPPRQNFGFVEQEWVVNVTAGSGTMEYRFYFPSGGAPNGNRLMTLFNMLELSARSGDAFQMRSSTDTGLQGTFDLDGWSIQDGAGGTFATGGFASVTMVISNAVGIVTGTYNDIFATAWLWSAAGFRGDLLAASGVVTDNTFSTAVEPETLVKFPKREDVALSPDNFALNIQWPGGFSLSIGGGASLTTLEAQLIELDSFGIEVATIGSPVVPSIEPARGQIISVLLSVVSTAAERFYGVRIKWPSTAVAGAPKTSEGIRGAVSARAPGKAYLVSAYQYGNKPGMTSNKSASTLTQVATRDSERRSTSKFNVRIKRKIPIFNSGTGLFGAFAFTQDFADIFMYHANQVGSIPLDQIDFDELYVIQDAINAADPEDGYFSYTFSNKNSPIDSELQIICMVARVNLYKEGSTYRFSRDESRLKTGNLTSRNIYGAGSKVITLSTPNPYDGILFEYIDPVTDKLATITVPTSPTPTRLKRMRIPGIRNSDQAWRRAQYEYLKLFSQRISREVITSREANLFSLGQRLTVYDHTRLQITPLATSTAAFRLETEIQTIDGTTFVGSERIVTDVSMAMELDFNHTGDGIIQNILINVDTTDTRKFTIDPSVPTITRDLILNNARQISSGLQIGERILIYPVAVTSSQLEQDDYIVIEKRPEEDGVSLGLIRYNENLYQFDGVSPP